MKIVIAPDSFKGSLTSMQIIGIIKEEALKVIQDCDLVEIPIADGGEGTIEALIHGTSYELIDRIVKGPRGIPFHAFYGAAGDTAIIEMAACSGLPLLENDDRNPKETTSIGTGQMIIHALNDGFRKFLIGIGGSATNDGGTGALEALGVKFMDHKGNIMNNMCGGKLKDIGSIDTSNLDPRLKDCDIQVMCDVNNPLTGDKGATFVYGPQKGADKRMLHELEEGMLHYEKLLESLFCKAVGRLEGAGAAGGMGAALMAFLDASLISGIEAVLNFVDFEERIKSADLIITGKGRVDEQSAYGKVIYGIMQYANQYKIPVVVIAGGASEGAEAVYELGVKAILTLPDRPMTLDACIENAEKLMARTSFNLFQLLTLLKRTP